MTGVEYIVVLVWMSTQLGFAYDVPQPDIRTCHERLRVPDATGGYGVKCELRRVPQRRVLKGA